MITFTESVGRLRLSPRMRKVLLAAHVMTSVGWLGVVLAKLVLALAAATAAAPETVYKRFTSRGVQPGSHATPTRDG
jgi:hypothetical protein